MRTARLLQRSMNFNDFRKLKQQAAASNQVFVRYTPAGPAGGRDLHKSAKYTRVVCEAVLAAWERQYRVLERALEQAAR